MATEISQLLYGEQITDGAGTVSPRMLEIMDRLTKAVEELQAGGGAGLPTGGTAGQVLTRQSDGSAAWESIVLTGGGA